MASKKYNSKEDFLSKWEPYFQKVADLQELLFDQNPDCDVNDFIPKIPNYFFKSKIQLIQLFSSIILLHFSRLNYHDFCINLITTLLPRFLLFLPKAEFASILEFQSRYYYLLFYELGLMTIDNILNKVKLFDDPDFFLYFHDIIEEKSNDEFRCLKSKYESAFANSDLHDFKNRRKIGKNDYPIALSIREDNIDKCQSIMSLSNITVDSRIPYSLFESVETINQKSNMPFLLEYAAYFGSIKCFKYFIMNNAPVTETVISYAIFGGNTDIIHICENIHAPLGLALRSSICCFRDDFYDYFQESLDIKFTDSAILCAIRNYNAKAILRFLPIIYDNPNVCDDRGDYPIIISASKDYIDILLMLSSINNIDYNITDQNGDTPIILSVINHHVLSFKILIEKSEVDVNKINLFGENLLMKLVENKYKGLLLDTLLRDDIIIMNPECHQNEIFTAISFENMNILKLFFDHAKYHVKINQFNDLAYFIIFAAINQRWEFVDYFLTKCKSVFKLLAIIDFYFNRQNHMGSIHMILRDKLLKYSKLDSSSS